MHQTQLNWRIFEYFSLDSTNDEAFRLYQAQGNDVLPNIVTSKIQTKGRGQFDRQWVSPEGNLYCSFSFSKSFLEWRLGERIDEAMITIKIGEAVFDCIKECIDRHINIVKEKVYDIDERTNTFFEPGSFQGPAREASGRGWREKSVCSFNLRIKPPNDILYNGKKLAGILCEVKNDLLVIGIGINVNNSPIIHEQNSSTISTTSIKEIKDSELSCQKLLKLLTTHIESIIFKGFSRIF